MSTEVLTIGQIADLLEQPPARINYVIAKNRIKPSARVANVRLFGERAVEKIRLELSDHSRNNDGK